MALRGTGPLHTKHYRPSTSTWAQPPSSAASRVAPCTPSSASCRRRSTWMHPPCQRPQRGAAPPQPLVRPRRAPSKRLPTAGLLFHRRLSRKCLSSGCEGASSRRRSSRRRIRTFEPRPLLYSSATDGSPICRTCLVPSRLSSASKVGAGRYTCRASRRGVLGIGCWEVRREASAKARFCSRLAALYHAVGTYHGTTVGTWTMKYAIGEIT